MTDLQQFEKLFGSMGVEYTKTTRDEPDKIWWFDRHSFKHDCELSVNQIDFCFKDGQFIGTEGSESAEFVERVEASTGIAAVTKEAAVTP